METLKLVRIEPSAGRGEQICLGENAASPLMLGRSESSEIRLLTPSASREHALLERDSSGAWWMTPTAGRSVFVDGEETSDPCLLEAGLNLRLGGDHLRCALGPVESLAAADSRDAGDSKPEAWLEDLSGRRRLGQIELPTSPLAIGFGLLIALALVWIGIRGLF